MSLLKSTITILFFSWLLPFQASSQDFLKTNGKAIVNSTTGDTIIFRGMGLGGWMVQEGYMLQTSSFAGPQHQIRAKIQEVIGEANTEIFYEKWLDNHVQKIDIDSLAAWGFNSVRLPMHYNLFTLPIEDEPIVGENTWLDKGFELTDSLISWCKQNEMWVILDLHAAPGGQGYAQEISDYDPTKPSLWESTTNQAKTVALWRKLAERYANEPWVGGYDLINEVNWDLPGGTQLRNLYGQITDAIREVDENHILFIEGNWFANDFTGLTPPWDNNMAYAPHKYWSKNEQEDIQWVLDIRDEYDVPLYLGESGENSNVWFRNAIRLLEDHEIGWAWWPMKKVESIAGPLSVKKTANYQSLLNYWEGNGTEPTVAETTTTLFELAENFKLENCFYQKDVIDAMFRQVYSDETKPFADNIIPGIVYASNFDLGRNGFAYSDSDVATYQVTTGNFTAWNSGWAFRNDGVDLEKSNTSLSNGFIVGFTSTNEWIQYEVDVVEAGAYSIFLAMANGSTDGAYHLSVDGADVSSTFYVPNTGGYDNWTEVSLSDIILMPGKQKLKLQVDEGGFNIASFNFIKDYETEDITTEYFSAYTTSEESVQLVLNKPMVGGTISLDSGFEIFVNGSQVQITDIQANSNNTRLVDILVGTTFLSTDVIKISYPEIYLPLIVAATDGTALQPFIQKNVENRVATIHPVPGRMEAEGFFFETGVILENTSDVGGGKNIGFLDDGDYLDYIIDVAADGTYEMDFRTASNHSANGQIQLQLIDNFGNSEILTNILLPPTGGWQTWETYSKTGDLEAGRHHLRVLIVKGSFNLNWIEFSTIVGNENLSVDFDFEISPNPSDAEFILFGKMKETQDLEIQVFDILGRNVFSKKLENRNSFSENLNLYNLESGTYFLQIKGEKGDFSTKKIIKK